MIFVSYFLSILTEFLRPILYFPMAYHLCKSSFWRMKLFACLFCCLWYSKTFNTQSKKKKKFLGFYFTEGNKSFIVEFEDFFLYRAWKREKLWNEEALEWKAFDNVLIKTHFQLKPSFFFAIKSSSACFWFANKKFKELLNVVLKVMNYEKRLSWNKSFLKAFDNFFFFTSNCYHNFYLFKIQAKAFFYNISIRFLSKKIFKQKLLHEKLFHLDKNPLNVKRFPSFLTFRFALYP